MLFRSKDSFEGIRTSSGMGKFPIVAGGKLKPPASADGAYAITVSMRQSAFKVETNGVSIVEYQLPAEAVAQIADSPVTVFVSTACHEVQFDLEEFSFVKLDNPGEKSTK